MSRLPPRSSRSTHLTGSCCLIVVGVLLLVALSSFLTQDVAANATPDEPTPFRSPAGIRAVSASRPETVSLADSGVFTLTVLHTNDTWGYILPCG